MSRVGLVQTVLGLASPRNVGVTMMHEHLIADYSKNFPEPNKESLQPSGGLSLEEAKKMYKEPLSIKNAGHVRQYYNHNKDNMAVDDAKVMANELKKYKALGGQTIVECSVTGLDGDPEKLVTISRESGVNIVTGTGFYLERTNPYPKNMDELTDEQLADIMVKEIQVGIGDTSVRAGIIGELGCSEPITENEKRVLRAGAIAQQKTGASITIHAGYSKQAPTRILDILEDAGADITRVVIGHIDRGILNAEDMIKVVSRGALVEFDHFGWGCSMNHALRYNVVFPSDFERCYTIGKLCNHGYADKVVIAHDIIFKSSLESYGGFGFGYILKSMVPFLRHIGLTESEIQTILVDSPTKLLTFVKPTISKSSL